MGAESERPPSSPWLVRAFLKAVAASCGVLSAGAMIFFFWVLSLSNRSPFLIPVTLLLLPVALVVILVGCLLWGISAACGVQHHLLTGVYAGVGVDGLELQSVQEANPQLVEWPALEEVLKVQYPLCVAYLLKLKQGSEIRVDFVDEGLLKRRLEENGTRFQEELWFSDRRANMGASSS